MRFYNEAEWVAAAKEKGYELSFWGNGSIDAYAAGEKRGTWTAFYDLNVTQNVANGTLY